MDNFLVSVIIPAFNCERTIADCLEAVLRQTHKNFEVIVVDDGSKDRSAQVIRSFENVRYLFQENSGPASARNKGARESNGEIIFFTDSDCCPESDWIELALAHFQDKSISVVAGSYSIANSHSRLARCIFAEIVFRHKKLMPRFPKSFGSYNFGVRRNVFFGVDGFDDSYRFASGEDNDLSYKILAAGGKILFERELRVAHFFPERTGKYLREQARHGFWRAKMYRVHPRMAKGDNYTFWKDIIEVLISCLLIFGLLLMLIRKFSLFGGALFVSSVSILLLLNIFFAFAYLKNYFESIFFAFVMCLRAFVRTLGFSSGMLRFFAPKK